MKQLLSILLLALPVHAQPRVAVDLFYDGDADSQCAGVEPPWIAELRGHLPALKETWGAMEPRMSQAVTELTGKPFTPSGTVRLTLCGVPSNSFGGATVNMRYALKSFTGHPVPLRYKADTAFHELLHGFVGKNVPTPSRLLAANASESSCVRNHLHLLALQKAVLLKVGDKEALSQVISIDGQLPSGCYRRAWALVNLTDETYQEYIAELSQ